jgi:hypothetical protein
MIRNVLIYVALCLFSLTARAQFNTNIANSEFPQEGVFENNFYGIINLERYPFEFKDNQVVVKDIISKNKYWVEIEDVDRFISVRNDLQSYISYHVIAPESRVSPLFEYHKEDALTPVKVISLSNKTSAINIIQSFLTDSKVNQNIVSGKVNNENLKRLSELPFVQYISPLFVQPKTLLPNMYTMNRANLAHKITSFGHGFKGKGIKVGVWDGGMINEHVDNTARLINVDKTFYFLDFTRHATHVSGIINSKGHRTLRNVGMAPEAFVYGYDFYGDIIKEMRSAVSNFNISITNNSFALGDYNLNCSNSGIYLPEAAELDLLVHDVPELLHVVAVGNAAFNTSTNNFNCDGREWGYVEVGFQGAKNNITVGWLSNVEALWVGSSRGPTMDGRLKPELVTKGASVNSLNETNLYANRWGSSQASPAVAGIAALVQEAYKEKYGFMPKAATVKAILLNSARDMGEIGPDFRFGFGLVNADRAIENVYKGNMLEGSVTHQSVYTQNISIPANTEKFQLTLCWSDLPAAPPYEKVLVNDLDLKIVGPGGIEYFPWILDPNQPQLAATKGIDTLNNFEQVTIMSPPAGNYSVQVRGKKIANINQSFSLAYNFDPIYLKLTNPVGGESFFPGEQVFICWDAEGQHTSFNVQLSLDNGNSWTNLATNLGPNRRYHAWTIPNATRSVQAKVRVVSNLMSDQSPAVFTVMPRVGTVNVSRCDRAANLSWTALVNSTGYIVSLLQNDEYVNIDTISSNSYTLTGLVNSNLYWVAVTAIYDTILAARSNGFPFRPASISCGFNNDLAIIEIVSPHSGRINTSIQLTNSEEVRILIKNYGTNPISNPQICYKLDNLDSVCINTTLNLAPDESDTVSLGNLSSLENIGTYKLKAWIKPPDDNPANNFFEVIIKHLPHEPLTLPYFQDFEIDTAYDLASNTYVLTGLEEYDFYTTKNQGRLGIALIDKYAVEGFGAVTMDSYLSQTENTNYLTLNLNLEDYQDANIYLDLSFLNHGNPNEGNDKVWVRGADNMPWLEVLKWGEKTDGAGFYTKLKAINLTRVLKNNGQDYSSSFQIRFGQQGTGAATDFFQVEGISLDNIAVYEAGDDIELAKVTFPDEVCKGLQVPLQIELINHSYQNIVNLPVTFEFKGSVFQEIIPNLSALDTIIYTFSSQPDLTVGGLYELKVYLNNSTDLYQNNDSIRQMVAVSEIVYSLPNYIDFESNAQFISTGVNNNWEWGIPKNAIISSSAEGDRAWVTGLFKNYLNEQVSYLYTPCYDLSGIEDSIQIAFNLILQIERNYDFLSIEYTDDGLNWNRLGTNGSGFNWFNALPVNSFWDRNVNRWKATTNYLKRSAINGNGILSFRFVFFSDLAATFEGAGIDDWHVTTLAYGINEDDYRKVSSSVVPTNLTHLLSGQQILASISHNAVQALNIDLEQKIKPAIFYTQNKYPTLRRSWVVKSNSNNTVNKKVSLYFTDSEYESLILLADKKAQSQLGILIYEGINEDTSYINNFWNRNYTWIKPNLVNIKPYDKGYVATFETDKEGEIYIVLDPAFVPDPIPALNSLVIEPVGCIPVVKSRIKNLPGTGTLRLESSTNGINYTVIYTKIINGNSNTTNFAWDVIDTKSKEGLIFYRVSFQKTDMSLVYMGVDTFRLVCPCPFISKNLFGSVCSNDSILIGNRYFTAGNHVDTFKTSNNCDSIVFAIISPLRVDEVFLNLEICSGDSIIVGNKWYNQSGVDTLTLANRLGCDSVLFISIEEKRIDNVDLEFSKCASDSLEVGGSWYRLPGVYWLNYSNQLNCDSIISVTINNLDSDTVSFNIEKCLSDSILFNSQWYKSSGIFYFNLSNHLGCDSVVQLNITDISEDNVFIFSEFLCAGDSVLVGSVWYSESGQYILNDVNSNGCDSVVSITIAGPTSTETTNANFSFEIDNLSVQFTNLSTSYNSLLWSLGDGTITSLENPLHNYPDNGIYIVKLIAIGDCMSDSLTLPLVLEEGVEFEVGIFVFPNPTSSELNVRMFIPTMTKVKLRLFNLIGQQLYHEDHSGDWVETTWDVSSLALGRYFLGIEMMDTNSKIRRYHYPVVIVR